MSTSIHKTKSRKRKSFGTVDFFKYYDRFMKESYKGIRTLKNGKKIRDSSVVNYFSTKKLLVEFAEKKNLELKLFLVNNLTANELKAAKIHNQKFYHSFVHFLYHEKNYYDNFVGLVIKVLRTFYNYLLDELQLNVGTFHKKFYSPKEEIPIITLSPEHLNYLIYTKELENTLTENQIKIKDIFVFGCTVGLRVSDLFSLQKFNLEIDESSYYLKVRSKKTGTFTRIKLPNYAVEILKKYETKSQYILPQFSNGFFNLQIKKIASLMNLNQPLIKLRSKNGEMQPVYKDEKLKKHYTLADHVTSHTMRRTAITTLLRLGTPAHVVRKISGHAAGSKEFYRYVAISQNYMDKETDKAFDKIENKLYI